MNEQLRKKMYLEILESINLNEVVTDKNVYEKIDTVLRKYGKQENLTYQEKKEYRDLLFAAFRRLDILSIAMDEEDVTEVMVNGSKSIFVEKYGKIKAYEGSFTTEEKLPDIIQQIASGINRRVNEASPMVDARLKDGSRVNIVLPPIALDGPAVTIRRFARDPYTMENLIEMGSLTRKAAEFLAACVKARYNIFISGGTGSGKTTFLGALADYIPKEERIITIEDSAELKLKGVQNIVRLESRPKSQEGEYEITIRDLIRNSLRMRPDRIIVGEIRGPEALDMLQAMNTGHDGSLSTGHANSAKDMISRIETMCLMGNVELPIPAIRSQIASGIDMIVHLSRLRDRSRRVTGIYEIDGIRENEVLLNPIYLFEEEKTDEEKGKVRGKLERTKNEFIHSEKFKSNYPEGLEFL